MVSSSSLCSKMKTPMPQRSHNTTTTAANVALLAISLVAWPRYLLPTAFWQERFVDALLQFKPQEALHLPPPSPERAPLNQLIRSIPAGPEQVRALKEALADPRAVTIVCGAFQEPVRLAGTAVELRDGARIALKLTDLLAWEQQKDRAFISDSSDGYFKLPTDSIVAIRPNPEPQYDFAWESLVKSSRDTESDILVIRRPDGKLDSITGILIRFSETHVEFSLNDEIIQAALGKIEGIILATPGAAQPIEAQDYQGIVCIGAHRIPYQTIDFTLNGPGEVCTITTAAGATISVPIAPMQVDRSQSLIYPLNDDSVTPTWATTLSPPLLRLPEGQRLPHMIPHKMCQVFGSGLETGLSIRGPTTVTIQLPPTQSLLFWKAVFPRDSAAYFSLSLQGSTEPFITKQPVDGPVDHASSLQQLDLPANGTLVIEVPQGEVNFERFVVLKVGGG